MICAECPNFEPNEFVRMGTCKKWKLTKYERELCQCDPCRYCQNFSESYDDDTGYIDYGCKADVEFIIMENVKPCPYYKPILASDGLFEQIAEWEDEKFWADMRKDDGEIDNE